MLLVCAYYIINSFWWQILLKIIACGTYIFITYIFSRIFCIYAKLYINATNNLLQSHWAYIYSFMYAFIDLSDGYQWSVLIISQTLGQVWFLPPRCVEYRGGAERYVDCAQTGVEKTLPVHWQIPPLRPCIVSVFILKAHRWVYPQELPLADGNCFFQGYVRQSWVVYTPWLVNDWALRAYNSQLLRLHWRRALKGHPSSQVLVGSAEASGAIASQFNSFFCPVLFCSLPYRPCSWEPSPKKLYLQISISESILQGRCNLENSTQKKQSWSQSFQSLLSSHLGASLYLEKNHLDGFSTLCKCKKEGTLCSAERNL